MNWQTISIATMVTGVLIAIAVDIFFLTRKSGATFSARLRAAGRKWQPSIMLVCFSFGLLCGHWFWTYCSGEDAATVCPAAGYKRCQRP